MKSRRILITGVAGMIGSYILDEVIEDNAVIGIDNLSFGNIDNIKHNLEHRNFEFFQLDVRKSLLELCEGIEIIFHMAAVRKVSEHEAALPTLTTIGFGTMNILEAAVYNKCKVVYASTSDVYGLGQIPFKENNNLTIGSTDIKRWAYAVAKLYGEQLCFAFHREYRMPVVILRYCGALSQRVSLQGCSNAHVPAFIDSILRNEPVTIHGDGSQTRPLLYIDDIIDCTMRAIENPKADGQIFNVGGDEEISILDTAKMIHKIADTGYPLKYNFIPMKEIFGNYQETMRRNIDMSKTEKMLGFKQQITLREGLKRVIDKWREVYS